MDTITHPHPQSKSKSILLTLLLLVTATGCWRREETPPEPAPLARVGNAVITSADVVAEAQRLRDAGHPATEAKAVLQALIEREAMLQEASASTGVNAPAARRERENLLLSQWLEHTLQAEKRQAALTDDELRTFYEANITEFSHPARVRLAILHRKPDHGTESSAETLTAALRQARQSFLDDPAGATRNGRIPGFGAIAVEASEDASSRYRGGDLGWLDTGRNDYRWPAEVIAAGFALPTGGISDVYATESGLYIVMNQDQRKAHTTPFEEVAATLRRRLLRIKHDEIEASFKSNLIAHAVIEIDAAQAAALSLPSPPQRQMKPPDLIPMTRFKRGDQATETVSEPEPGKEENK
ncbi:MAG: peptidyl-prolyl cis-trans isomerase [Coriobacteriia bacterium]|nr:peptidyl-prolyl cis-trans isomerase [Coriobacteriia bacterium]